MLEKYNYLENVIEDVKEAINDRYTEEELVEKLSDVDTFAEELNDDLWTDDSITGNASGSYTFNTWTAEEYIAHNMDLLSEALSEFGETTAEALERGAEYCDVTIRCYLLSQAIQEALEELEEDYSEEIEAFEEMEEA